MSRQRVDSRRLRAAKVKIKRLVTRLVTSQMKTKRLVIVRTSQGLVKYNNPCDKTYPDLQYSNGMMTVR